jgi:uncharacterized protein YndB with AHSA1/START domain
MTAPTQTTTTHVFRVHIKATPEAIWEAITSPEWTARYGYRASAEFELRPGGAYRVLANDGMKAMGMNDVVVEGQVIESDPPKRLVQTWRMLFDAAQAAEPLTTITWEIEPLPSGSTRLTVIHDVTGAPIHESLITGDVVQGGGGWPYILSDLKSLLETGTALISEA